MGLGVWLSRYFDSWVILYCCCDCTETIKDPICKRKLCFVGFGFLEQTLYFCLISPLQDANEETTVSESFLLASLFICATGTKFGSCCCWPKPSQQTTVKSTAKLRRCISWVPVWFGLHEKASAQQNSTSPRPCPSPPQPSLLDGGNRHQQKVWPNYWPTHRGRC